MVSSTSPCGGCIHADVCMYKDDTLAAHRSLVEQSYWPSGPNTKMPYKAAKRLLFSVHCKFYKGDGLNDGHALAINWDDSE